MSQEIIPLILFYDGLRYSATKMKAKRTMEQMGLEYTLEFIPEECIDNLENVTLPAKAIVYVHGSLMTDNYNFHQVLSHSPKRADLKWIVEFDERFCQDYRFRENDYQSYRQLRSLSDQEFLSDLEAIKKEVIIKNVTGPGTIFNAPHDTYPQPFQIYLKTLLQVRKDE